MLYISARKRKHDIMKERNKDLITIIAVICVVLIIVIVIFLIGLESMAKGVAEEVLFVP